MKKLLTSILVFACLTVSAQGVDTTFQFVDEDGNVIEDGAEITVKGLTPESAYAEAFIDSGIYVQNTTDAQAGVGLTLTISRIDNGVLSCCFPQSCNEYSYTVTDEENGKGFLTANQTKTLQTEFYPAAYGTCTAKFQLRVHENTGALNPGDQIATGPTITINFVYDETSAGIDGVPADESEVVGVYTLDGKLLDSPTKGVNLLRMSDGSTKKLQVK